MFPWSKSETSRGDLRLLQIAFDAEANSQRRAAELAEALRGEPPVLIGLALLVFMALALPFGVAVLP